MKTETETNKPRPEAPTTRLRRRFGWRQASLFAGALLGGSIAGAGGMAYAAMMTNGMGWHQGHRLEMIQRRVHAALDSVGATTVQEDKIHDIIANGFSSMGNPHEDRMALGKQMVDLLRAPTIDRVAVEKLRADEVAKFDARSKTIVGVVLDSADQLKPEQRAALADRLEAMMAHGHGRWHDGAEGRDGGPHGMGYGPDDNGQDGGDRGPGGPGGPDGNPG